MLQSNQTVHPPLAPTALRDVIDLCLWAGQLLLQNGANSDRVESTVHRIGTGLGCNWLDVFVSSGAIIITANNDPEFRTKTRRVVRVGGVNLALVAELSDLSFRVASGEIDRFALREAFTEISKRPRHYNRWLTAVLVGLGCLGFAILYGGSPQVLAVTWLASTIAMLVRQELTHRFFNQIFTVLLTAFVAAFTVGILQKIFPQVDLRLAYAASVLLLVPGVPLINAIDDLLSGHSTVGMARGITGGLFAFNIALGITLAIRLLGISHLWQTIGSAPNVGYAALGGALSATCFAVLFNVPPKNLPYIAVMGALAIAFRYAMLLVLGLEIGTLVSASLIGIAGHYLAIHNRMPTITFTLAPAITMVPGSLAFGAMIGILTLVGQLPLHDKTQVDILVQTAIYVTRTGILLAAIATGATFAKLFLRPKPIV